MCWEDWKQYIFVSIQRNIGIYYALHILAVNSWTVMYRGQLLKYFQNQNLLAISITIILFFFYLLLEAKPLYILIVLTITPQLVSCLVAVFVFALISQTLTFGLSLSPPNLYFWHPMWKMFIIVWHGWKFIRNVDILYNHDCVCVCVLDKAVHSLTIKLSEWVGLTDADWSHTATFGSFCLLRAWNLPTVDSK